MDDNNDRRPSLEETLARSAELMAESERLLAPSEPAFEEPAATYDGPTTHDWRPASHYRGYKAESLRDALKKTEAAISRRLDTFEARVEKFKNETLDMFDVTCDEVTSITGPLERRANKMDDDIQALRKELEGLRGEVTLLRAQANRPQKASVKPRAPFALSDGDVLRN
jgi:hypothetical protein